MIPRKKKLVLPGLIWDNQNWVPVSTYPGFICYTDSGLARILNVSVMLVGQWKKANVIPYTMNQNFACYNVNDCIEALLKNGYKQDINLKSTRDD